MYDVYDRIIDNIILKPISGFCDCDIDILQIIIPNICSNFLSIAFFIIDRIEMSAQSVCTLFSVAVLSICLIICLPQIL